MKNLILLVEFLITGTNAMASAEMNDEIVCNKINQSGEADNGVTVALKSNKTSWVKLVQIVDNGYAGSRVIGAVQVPLQPKLIAVPTGGYIPEIDMIYEGNEVTLSIRALNISHSPLLLQGTGSIDLRLPGYEPSTISLNCGYAE